MSIPTVLDVANLRTGIEEFVMQSQRLDSVKGWCLRPRVAAFALAVAVGLPGFAFGQTWTSTTSGNWNTAGNWTTLPVSGTTTGLTFGGSTAYTATNNIGAFTLNSLAVTNTNATTIDGGTGLTFAGTTPAVSVAAGSGATTIAGPLAFSAATSITNNSAALLTLSGALGPGTSALTFTGSGNTTVSGAIGGTTATVTKSGAGTLILTGTNTNTGATTISAGTLQIGNGGTSGSLGTGSVAVTGTLVFNRSDTLVMSNVLTGAGNIVMNGSGTINQQSNSSFTGTLTVNAGTFISSGQATGTFNFNAASIVVNNGGTFQFGQGGVTGENPNHPNSTYVTANTGGLVRWLIGEDLGGLNLSGGTMTFAGGDFNAQGTTAQDWRSGTLNGTANALGGSAAINKTTTGTVTIAGSATLGGTGAINIQEGTIAYTADANFTTTRPITLGTASTTSGTLEYMGATPAAAKAQAITLNATGGALRVTTAGANLTLSGVIGGTGGLTKQGSGTLTLTGVNTYSGGTTIPNGTANTVGGIAITASSGSGNGPLGTGTLTVGTAGPSAATVASGNTPFLNVNQTAAVTLANNIAIPTTPATATVYSLQKASASSTTGTNLVLSGVLSGGNANTTLMLNSNTSGDSTTTYQLSGINTLAGKVRVNRGAVILDSADALGTATLESATNTNTVLTTGGNVRLNGAFTLPNNVFIGTANNTISSLGNVAGISGVISGSVAWGKLGTGTLVLTGTNTISGAASILEGTLQIGNGGTTGSLPAATSFTNNGTLAFNRSDAITYSGVISGTGGVSQQGTGTTTLTAANTYTGGTTIAAGGTLQIGAGGTSGVLPGDVTTSGTLAFNRSDAVTFAGAISGTGGVSKLGSGTTTLTGTLSYGGPTTVSAGTLALAPFATTSETTIAGGAGLTVVNGPVPGTLTTPTLSLGAAGSTLRFALASGNPTAPLLNVTALEGLNLNGGTHTLTVTNSAALSVGQFALIDYDNATPLTSGFTLSALPGRTAGNLVYNTANTSVDLNVTGADTITYTAAIDNTWDAGTAVDTGGTQNFKVVGMAANNGNPTNFIPGDAVRFDDTASGPNTPFAVNLTTALAPLMVTVDNSANSYTFQGTGSLAGTGSLTLLGTSSLTLLTNNTYSGTTTVSGGTLVIGDGGTTGSLGTGPVVNNAAVVMNRSDAVTITGPISGSGTLTKSGTNNLTVSGAYTSSGDTVVSDGMLTLNAAAAYSYAGRITGAGGLTKQGTATVTLAGANGYTGGTTVSAGTLTLSGANSGTSGYTVAAGSVLQVGNGGTSGSIAANIANAGTVTFNRSDAATYGGVLSGAGGLTKLGAGTLTLTGINTASGVTTISAGTLQLGSGGATGSVAGNIAGSGTLLVNRTDDFTMANAMSGTLSLAKTGTNTLTLTGTNTQTGPITITQGVLSVALSTNLGGAVIANLNGGTLRITGAYSDTAQTFNAGPAGGTLDIAPGVEIVKTGGLVTGAGNTLTITGGGTLSLQGSGASNISNVVVQNGIYRHTSARYVAANATPYSVTVQPGGTLMNMDTTTFNGASYFPFGNLSGVTGSSLTLNGDGYAGGAGAATTTMFGAYLHALDEASTAATNTATTNIAVPVTLASTSRFTLAVGSRGTRTASDRIVDSLIGGVSGPGGLILDGDGNGTLAISTVPATYQGSTRVAAGTLRVGLNNALPTGTVVTLGATSGDNVPTSSGTLSLNGLAQEVAGLGTVGTGTANRVVGGAATLAMLTVNLASGSQSFAGVLGGPGSNDNNLSLVKSGAGVWRLVAANTYAGGTAVNGGTLEIANALGLGQGNVTIASGGTLKLPLTPQLGSSTIALSPGGLLQVASGVSAPLAGSSWLGGWQIDPSTLGQASTAGILSGTVPAGGTTLSGSWILAAGDGQYSDVLSLTGTGAGNAFVLSLAYAATTPQDVIQSLNIGQRAGPGGDFVPVGTAAQGIGVPWTSAFNTVGQYGVDTATQTVWVVTDQNSQFVVVPEPAIGVVGGLAMLGLATGIAFQRRSRAPDARE